MAGFASRAALLLGAVLPALATYQTNEVPPTTGVPHGSVVPGKYIVKVRPEIPDCDFDSQVQWAADVHKRSLSRRDTKGLRKTFKFDGFKAYSGEFDEATVEMIRANDTVCFFLLLFFFSSLECHHP